MARKRCNCCTPCSLTFFVRLRKKLCVALLALLLAACGAAEGDTALPAPSIPTRPATTAAQTTVPVTTEDPAEAQRRALEAALVAALDAAPVQGIEEGDLRPFPYPYRAMLALTSDCDSTKLEVFEGVHRFLNTREETDYGPGLGLDVGDSFFLYNGSNDAEAAGIMTWCEGTDPGVIQSAAVIQKYYACGWIDSLHAFGDFSRSGGSRFTRALAEAAWAHLEEAGIAPTVWIDHGNASNLQNFGAYNPKNASSYQAGDDPASPYYHLDLTLPAGVRYVWYSRHSHKFGQDFPLSERELRDGSTVWSFTRYCNEMNGNEILWNWRPNQLNEQITEARLDSLEQKGQYALVGQHLTMYQARYQPEADDLAALRMLAERHHAGRILVARTSRLLDYAVATRYITFQTAEVDGRRAIRLLDLGDPTTGPRTPTPDELRGLTFYCEQPENVMIFVGDVPLEADLLQINPADDSGQASIGIRWFEADVTDYTK